MTEKISKEATASKGRILITGATGAVGPRVVRSFLDAGCKVRTLSLDAPQAGTMADGLDVRIGDITDQQAVQAAMGDVDGVVHLAALLHILDPPPEMQKEYERINVGGTQTVVDAAIQLRVKRVVLFSTIAVYGHTGGGVIAEETPPRPDTFYAGTKLAAERIVLGARRADGKPLGAVLRLAAVYGARIKGNYQRLFQALARGMFVPLGDGRNRRTVVYDRDVAEAATLVMSHPSAGGRIYNVSDGYYHTMAEIIGAMCHALGRRPPPFSLPVSPVRFTAGMLEDAAQMIGLKSPIVRSTIDKYVEDIAVDGGLIQKELGFRPKFNLTDGWQDTVQEMRCAGRL
ncbi:MAG: NAD-dependent epimerase/dehydratase family protein [Deltaproteobacteria bacterium]|nr:NAD-dependent epimerase/dehydratase family protein [Deltaproteobacteria bacterium]